MINFSAAERAHCCGYPIGQARHAAAKEPGRCVDQFLYPGSKVLTTTTNLACSTNQMCQASVGRRNTVEAGRRLCRRWHGPRLLTPSREKILRPGRRASGKEAGRCVEEREGGGEMQRIEGTASKGTQKKKNKGRKTEQKSALDRGTAYPNQSYALPMGKPARALHSTAQPHSHTREWLAHHSTVSTDVHNARARQD